MTTQVVRRSRAPGIYAPLQAYLRSLPRERADVRLTLKEIETLLGMPLCSTAQYFPFYWAKTIAQHWQAVGFSARLDTNGRCVTFTRGGLP